MVGGYGFLVMAVVLLLTGYGKKDAGSAEQTAKPASDEIFTLRIGSMVSDIDPFNVAYREFEEEVEEAFEGRIQVELFASGSIGETDADVLDKIHSNTLQMGNTAPNCFVDLSGVSEYYVYEIPYPMSTDEELSAIAGSEWFMGLNKDFAKTTGVKVFDGGVNTGWFSFSAAGREIHQIVDLKGMAIRINQTNQMIALSEGAGINPQFTALSEVYTALAQSTVDGMVTSVPLFYSDSFYDQLESILTTHCRESYHFYIINDEPYNSFPDDSKPITDKSVGELIARTRELEVDHLEEAIGKMREKNVIVIEVSKEDEDMLRRISVDKVWWGENASLTSKKNAKRVLEILGCTDEAQ